MKKKTSEQWFQLILIFAAEVMTVVAVALFLCYIWCYQYTMVGNSMSPEVESDEIVLVDRSAYLLREPQRFDVVLLRNASGDLTMKRLIGLPGDTVQIVEGMIWINGEELSCPYITEAITYAGIAAEPIVLEDEEYFVLGDDTQFSEDSRSADFGLVKRENLIGKPWFVLFPIKNMRPIAF